MTPRFHFVPIVSAKGCHFLGSIQDLWNYYTEPGGEHVMNRTKGCQRRSGRGVRKMICLDVSLVHRCLLSIFYVPGISQVVGI